ncbi:hypothetical protein JYU34_019485 [Plutella xylostella]|uniref:beta-N-acetylhexosaminidase n=2 Tax=Plutella xylostella TaxID=51655 RepID=A0ABQ7PX53_PLUXY|nr:hypothetical protein JYU34_019485 [Plutella xylostella]
MVIYRRRTKVILALTSLIAIYCCTQLRGNKSLDHNLPKARSDTILPYVVFHLDFKGAPPKLSYITSLLNNLRLLGVTALLMEYEDMFPYEGSLKKLKAPNCYSRVELQQFLSKAVSLGLEIIPLVQTFGHLEFVLKHKEYVHLCENRTEYGSICPSKKESRILIRQMLEQILTFHEAISPVKHLHVGCDEVFHLNECKLCREQQLSKIVQYERHVAFICDTVHDLSPHTTVLIWDDMLQQHSDLMQPISLPVEPVAWDYAANIQLKPANIYKLYKNYKTIWIASAYKGADGETALYPNLEVRFRNHYSWVQQLMKYEGLTQPSIKNFKGRAKRRDLDEDDSSGTAGETTVMPRPGGGAPAEHVAVVPTAASDLPAAPGAPHAHEQNAARGSPAVRAPPATPGASHEHAARGRPASAVSAGPPYASYEDAARGRPASADLAGPPYASYDYRP